MAVTIALGESIISNADETTGWTVQKQPQRLKSMNATVEIDGNRYVYKPEDDLTVIELSKITEFLIGLTSYVDMDCGYYLKENNLMRHFKKEGE